MNAPSAKTRQTFTWSQEARELVRNHLAAGGPRHRLITSLVKASGHPRWACLRFAQQLGVTTKRPYRKWSEKETQTLLQLCESYPLRTIALKMRRSETAIRGMLERLGTRANFGSDNFTKYGLAQALHVRPQRVQQWIDQGLLPAHKEGTEKLPRVIITADDFVDFVKKHRDVVLRGHVREDRLNFLVEFAFPRSHVDLLPVREAKKERAAYASQLEDEEEDGFGAASEPMTNQPADSDGVAA